MSNIWPIYGPILREHLAHLQYQYLESFSVRPLGKTPAGDGRLIRSRRVNMSCLEYEYVELHIQARDRAHARRHASLAELPQCPRVAARAHETRRRPTLAPPARSAASRSSAWQRGGEQEIVEADFEY